MSTTKGVVIPVAGGLHLDMAAPGRFAARVDERNELRERYRWEVVGPNPL
jgi:hypothetical protein